jgi:hypothetical protein
MLEGGAVAEIAAAKAAFRAEAEDADRDKGLPPETGSPDDAVYTVLAAAEATAAADDAARCNTMEA